MVLFHLSSLRFHRIIRHIPIGIILTHDDPYASPDFSVFISDINGDGKDDIFQISEEQGAIKHTVFHSKGLGFNKDIWYYWSKQNPDVPHVEIYDHQGFIDFNADGKGRYFTG
jgi:hypothetical protein